MQTAVKSEDLRADFDLGVAHRRADLKIHPIDDEALIYDPLTADTHRLNATAYFIWRQFEGGTHAEEIAQLVAESYDVNAGEAKNHVERFLRELLDRNLILYQGMESAGTAID